MQRVGGAALWVWSFVVAFFHVLLSPIRSASAPRMPSRQKKKQVAAKRKKKKKKAQQPQQQQPQEKREGQRNVTRKAARAVPSAHPEVEVDDDVSDGAASRRSSIASRTESVSDEYESGLEDHFARLGGITPTHMEHASLQALRSIEEQLQEDSDALRQGRPHVRAWAAGQRHRHGMDESGGSAFGEDCCPRLTRSSSIGSLSMAYSSGTFAEIDEVSDALRSVREDRRRFSGLHLFSCSPDRPVGVSGPFSRTFINQPEEDGEEDIVSSTSSQWSTAGVSPRELAISASLLDDVVFDDDGIGSSTSSLPPSAAPATEASIAEAIYGQRPSSYGLRSSAESSSSLTSTSHASDLSFTDLSRSTTRPSHYMAPKDGPSLLDPPEREDEGFGMRLLPGTDPTPPVPTVRPLSILGDSGEHVNIGLGLGASHYKCDASTAAVGGGANAGRPTSQTSYSNVSSALDFSNDTEVARASHQKRRTVEEKQPAAGGKWSEANGGKTYITPKKPVISQRQPKAASVPKMRRVVHSSAHVVPPMDPKSKPRRRTKGRKVGHKMGREGVLHGGCYIDWNKEFQDLLELEEDTMEAQLHKYEGLRQLASDFVHTAKTIGKLIIAENFLDEGLRTVRPKTVGGQAGGEKFVHHGILFKFAKDWRKLYGGDGNAMKAAAHELKGVMRMFPCDKLHVPLMALIDYRGFRIVAESLLPISQDTLRYGSRDGGITVQDSQPELSRAMRDACRELNLKEHVAGVVRDFRRSIAGPADIEGHFGLNENEGRPDLPEKRRFYVIDFARLFPPTAESDDVARRTFLFHHFRPEFVRNYHLPLSSDGYSHFGADREHEHNAELRDATDYLFNTIIPNFAADLGRMEPELVGLELTEQLHRAGINVRYLGLVRQCVPTKELQIVLLHEMCARVIKNRLRALMRAQAKTLKTGREEEHFRAVIIRFLNEVLGHKSTSGEAHAGLAWFQLDEEVLAKEHCRLNLSSDGDAFGADLLEASATSSGSTAVYASGEWWTKGMRVRLQAHFRDALLEEEQHPKFDLRCNIDMHKLFLRLESLTGVKLTKEAMTELKSNPDTYRIVLPDIKKVSATVKHMNIVSLAEGKALAIQALMEEGGRSANRLFKLAMSKFETAIRATPDNKVILNDYGDMLRRFARGKQEGKQTYELFNTAYQKYSMAGNYNAIFDMTEEIIAATERKWAERSELLSLCHECFTRILKGEQGGAAASWWIRWAELLLEHTRLCADYEKHALAGAKFRAALERMSGLRRSALQDEDDGLNDLALGVHGALSWASGKFHDDVDNAVLLEIWLHNRSSGHDQIYDLDASVLLRRDLLSQTVVAAIAQNCPVRKMCFAECSHLLDPKGSVLQAAVRACRYTLRVLDLNWTTGLTAEALRRTVSAASASLMELHIAGCAVPDLANCLFETGASNDDAWWCNIEVIDVSDCPDADDSLLENLQWNCGSLRVLKLCNNRATSNGYVCRAIHNLANLSSLHFGGCINLSNDVLMQFGKRGRGAPPCMLTQVHLGNCMALTGEGVVRLAKACPHLTHVNLSNCVRAVTAEALAALGRCPLRSLVLRGCRQLTDGALLALAHEGRSPQLETLNLASCSQLSNNAIMNVMAVQRGLRKVNLAFCSNIRSGTLKELAKHGTTITSLNLNSCSRLSTEALLLLTACPNLRHLDIGNINKKRPNKRTNLAEEFTMVEDVIASLAPVCTDLESLVLAQTNATDACLQALALHCHKLTRLDVSGCKSITMSLAPAWPGGCPQIRWLSVENCEYISLLTPSGEMRIECLQSLRFLNVAHCDAVNDKFLALLPFSLPSLELFVCGGRNKMSRPAMETAQAQRPSLRFEQVMPGKGAKKTHSASGLSSAEAPDVDGKAPRKPWKVAHSPWEAWR